MEMLTMVASMSFVVLPSLTATEPSRRTNFSQFVFWITFIAEVRNVLLSWRPGDDHHDSEEEEELTWLTLV